MEVAGWGTLISWLCLSPCTLFGINDHSNIPCITALNSGMGRLDLLIDKGLEFNQKQRWHNHISVTIATHLR